MSASQPRSASRTARPVSVRSPSMSSQPSVLRPVARSRDRTSATTASPRLLRRRATAPMTKPVAPVRKTLTAAYSRASPVREASRPRPHPRARLPQDEALGERVVGREEKLAPARDPRAALDLGNNRVLALPAKLARDAPGEASSQDALHDERPVRCEATPRALDRDAPGDAGPGGGAIDLALSEDAHVPRVGVRR